MGILDDIRRAHVGTRGMSYVDRANRRLASMPADLLGDSGGAIAELEILRGDLVRILHVATADDLEHLFGDAITELAQGDDGVKASFQCGQPRRFDPVVGADGLHSGVRGLAFGPEAAFVRHLGAYVLAGELAAADGDHHTAFARYQTQLREYVTRGQKLAKGNAAGLIPRSRSQIWLRNQFIRALPYMPWKGLVAGGVHRAANAITLEDYQR